MTNAIWDEKSYYEYLEDIDIARKAIKEEYLYPDDEEIMFDIYAIPSHNHQAYYAVLYKKTMGTKWCMPVQRFIPCFFQDLFGCIRLRMRSQLKNILLQMAE